MPLQSSCPAFVSQLLWQFFLIGARGGGGDSGRRGRGSSRRWGEERVGECSELLGSSSHPPPKYFTDDFLSVSLELSVRSVIRRRVFAC
jgi:hypothetical protein